MRLATRSSDPPLDRFVLTPTSIQHPRKKKTHQRHVLGDRGGRVATAGGRGRGCQRPQRGRERGEPGRPWRQRGLGSGKQARIMRIIRDKGPTDRRQQSKRIPILEPSACRSPAAHSRLPAFPGLASTA